MDNRLSYCYPDKDANTNDTGFVFLKFPPVRLQCIVLIFVIVLSLSSGSGSLPLQKRGGGNSAGGYVKSEIIKRDIRIWGAQRGGVKI